ncbi:MAG: glycosyl hydrolase [Ignavibacteria bacterium]|nr:glycosyl hydrolase [Ignavibacteria bacterium]
MKRLLFSIFLLTFVNINIILISAEQKETEKINQSSIYSNIKFRSIGPAIASGRVIDLAINPNNFDEFYVAVASGGVWKTTNHGTTFTPIFDNENSYSIGCITIDPKNTNVIWVGSGENNSQRSVSYGDGVYKSEDGGKSWKNVGLKNSEHIGKIIIDPNNSDVVWVASQGPLWKEGGDRGLYKTTDGGKTWDKSLDISENTGISDIVMDPRDSKVLYASAYQRRRHVWTLINGGPEGAIYKTVDGGKTWDKLSKGLPSGDIGRIGLAISNVEPDYLYAIIEASENNGGFFKSTDRGASWSKQSDHVSSSPQYYQEIVTHPTNKDIVYSLSTYTQITYDGGKNFSTLPLGEKHVDDHAIWINPENPDNILIGCDGGLYETFDAASNWRFFENLPVTQFYRVTVDNDYPFYNVYGGTQDNNTLGGPSRTLSDNGIKNEDWIFTVGGDGFKTVIDPKDPNIVYSQPQYGFLVRYDKKSGEFTGIQPQPEKDEILKWNWNSPVIISPHDNRTLYFAANKIFKSTNRGDSWTKISEDLTRKIDRNTLKVMGKVWPPESVAKNQSTSVYGNIVSLDESPLEKGLLYVGTDDGLIQVSKDDGKSWNRISSFTSIPETTYVSDITASLHNENVVYATFDNRKNGDFKPYIIMSKDMGNSWNSITGNLPENLPVHSIVQDHLDKDLLFIGTEFGVYFTKDNGKNWVKFSNGLPTISIREIDIQRRENDLALASFGRGFYILDNYSPIREASKEILEKDAHIFNIKDALMYIEDRSKGRNSLGKTYYRADNPEFGVTVTYYIKDNFESLKSKRLKEEKDNKGNYTYPTFTQLEKEDIEKSPYLLFTFKDMNGNIVRRIKNSISKGINRFTWDMRYADTAPLTNNSRSEKYSGIPILPGDYTVELHKVHNGEITELVSPVKFTAKTLDNRSLPATNPNELVEMQKEAFEIRRVLIGADKYLEEASNQLNLLSNTIINYSDSDLNNLKEINTLEDKIYEIKKTLNGNSSLQKRATAYVAGLNERLGNLLYSFWYSSSAPTNTQLETIKLIKEEFRKVESEMLVIDNSIQKITNELQSKNSPWLPGRVPKLK